MIDEKTFRKIVKEYGTPSFVFDAQEVMDRVAAIRTLLDQKIGLVFSIKANSFLTEFLAPVVDYLEVCSPGELSLCKAYGIAGDKILYSGVNKGIVDITSAVEHKAAIYTAESIRHYHLLCEVAKEHGTRIPVILRLTSGNQFGMSRQDIESILAEWSLDQENSSVDIIGLHYFAGTQRKKLAEQEQELGNLVTLIDELEEKYDVQFRHLEYGPGLPFPYYEGEDFSDTLAPLKALLPKMLEVADRIPLAIEMGRFLVSSCGYYLSQVADTKCDGNVRYAILDGGMHHLNYLGQMMGMKNPMLMHLPEEATAETGLLEPWTVCGSLCTTADVIMRKRAFDNLQIGDTIVFCNCGAYTVTEGINLFLSRTMPNVLLVDESGDVHCLRPSMESYPINMRQ